MMLNGLFTRLAESYLRKQDRDLSFVDFATWAGQGKMRPTDYASQVKAYRGYSFICSNINANAVAANPRKLLTTKKPRLTPTKALTVKEFDYLKAQAHTKAQIINADEAQEVVEHPLLDLMQNVNPFMNSFDLMHLTSIYLDLAGNCYWYTPLNGLRRPGEIWIIPPQYMKVIPDKEKFIKGYICKRGMEEKRFEEEEVIHFKWGSPLSDFYGSGALLAIAEEYNLMTNMTSYESALFKNLGMPAAAIIVKQGLTKDQRKRFAQQWKQIHGGVNNAGKTAVLEADVEIKELSFAPKEMSFLSGRRMTVQIIANAFGVPVSMLTTDSVNRANAEAGLVQHARNAVRPRCMRMDEKLNEKLCPKFDSGLFFASDDPVPEDQEAAIKENDTYTKDGIMTINEARNRVGLEPLDGFDVPWLPMNLVPAGSGGDMEAQIEHVSDLISKRVREKLAKVS